jgi:hypothetical protein
MRRQGFDNEGAYVHRRPSCRHGRCFEAASGALDFYNVEAQTRLIL